MASALRNVARTKLRVAMIPADGIGREVLPARTRAQYDLYSILTLPKYYRLLGKL